MIPSFILVDQEASADRMKDRSARVPAITSVTDAMAVSRSLALAARRQHVDRVLQAMSTSSITDRPSQLIVSSLELQKASRTNGFEKGSANAPTNETLHPNSFQTPGHKKAQQDRWRLSHSSDAQGLASDITPRQRNVAYTVPGCAALADYSQSQTVTEFLRSCRSLQHGVERQAMPPLPPDVGSSMEKLLLDQICQLCQERATLVAKQQSSEQLIKHLEERVMYLEDCLDQSPGTTTDEHATIDGGLTSAEQDACNVQYG